MTISLQSIPSDLKADKSVTPYIARALELESVNVVVSYYCKLYVLDYILSNKLHTTSKDIEKFTIDLLDDTESVKNSADDEGTKTALNDKSVSVSIVLSFAYKLFNLCLEGLSGYSKSTNKPALVGKFRATLVFLSLLTIFVNSNEEIDWAKLTGGNAVDGAGFEKLNKEKTKTLKYQLSRLLKDEVPFKDEGKEFEKELIRELEELELGGQPEEQEEGAGAGVLKLPGAPQFLPQDSNAGENEDDGPFLPSAPKVIASNEDSPILPSTPKTLGSDEPELPPAPHFSPDEEAEEFKLPGAPKYLPDDDLSHINKTSSIQVFTPEKKSDPAPPPGKKAAPKPGHIPGHKVTKADIENIIDKTELIAKVQKHAKFAISALNYEDVDTAETELREGLRLLEILKKQEEK